MNETMLKTLVEIILTQLYQLEVADDVDEDFSVNLMEQSAASLQSLNAEDAKALLNVVTVLADVETNQNRKEYLQKFGENFGIVDVIS